jgi:two-component system, chemotaxis family, sensor kinase CheA
MDVNQDNSSYVDNDLVDSMMDEYKGLFLMEVKEHLQNINDCLISYEKNSEETERLDEIFRSAHTIKGSSAMMGYDDISKLTHAMEDAFDLLRKGSKMPPGLMDLIFGSLDLIENRIKDLENGVDKAIDLLDREDRIRDAFKGIESNEKPSQPVENKKSSSNSSKQDQFKLQSIKSIRVQTTELDRLMNLIGELVINKGQLTQILSHHTIPEVKHTLENVDRLSTELQDIVTHIRMVPVGQVFNRFPRLVRDLSHQKGNQVSFIMDGKDIELDRKVLEEIGEPLIHLLRNAVDHGIEEPSVREAQGKKPEGTIRLSASRNQDHIMIIVEDDGAGIDPEKIKEKALREKILSEAEINALTDEQLISLIMINGFSTAKDVTEVSGRGVGMNVVKNKIEALGGSIILESTKGEGSRFALKLPMTLSILKAMIVESGKNTYAIPIKFVEENVSVQNDTLHNLGSSKAIKLRDRILKILHLNTLLDTPVEDNGETHKQILVIKEDTTHFGLQVDRILGMREIMTKNIKETLQGLSGISGVTILGDGQVIIVIDPINLLQNYR